MIFGDGMRAVRGVISCQRMGISSRDSLNALCLFVSYMYDPAVHTHNAYSVSGGGECENIVWNGSGSRGWIWGGVMTDYAEPGETDTYKYIHRNEL